MTILTTISSGDVKRRGVGYYTARCALRDEVFQVEKGARPVAVLVSVERFARLERAAAELDELRAKSAA